MAMKAVVDAVTERLASHWTKSPVLKENQEGDAPAAGGEFIVVQFPFARTRRWAMNERFFIEEGGFRLVMNVRPGSGIDKLSAWGDELAALFREVIIVSAAAPLTKVRCQTPTSPFTDRNSDAGKYFTGTVTCPYWATFRDQGAVP